MRTVARVLDGETLTLDDGSVVRLIGALAPRARDAGDAPGAWPPESEAVKALSDLVLGKKVKLAFGGRYLNFGTDYRSDFTLASEKTFSRPIRTWRARSTV